MNKIQSYAHMAARSGPESSAGPPPPAHGGEALVARWLLVAAAGLWEDQRRMTTVRTPRVPSSALSLLTTSDS